MSLKQKYHSLFNVIRQAYDDSQKAQEQLAVMKKTHSLPDFSPADNHYDRKLRSCALHDQGYRLESNILKIDAAMDELAGRICVYNTISAETQAKAFTPEVCDIWSDFRILDPYGLCFACLYLLDNGSDFPWIYGINSNLMGFCANALPWLVDYSLFPLRKCEKMRRTDDCIPERITYTAGLQSGPAV